MIMKKQYIAPQLQTVNVRLYSSVLDDIGLGGRSQGIGGDDEWNDAKETAFDAFDTEEDIWSGRQTKDVWER